MCAKRHLFLLAGGKGERLWPISTEDQPKQFLKIFENQSLFERACRLNDPFFDEYHVLSQEKYFFLILDQLEGFKQKKIKLILEPMGRGTLPIVVLSLLKLNEQDFFFIAPSDHYIPDINAYRQSIQTLIEQNSSISLLGKIPKDPNTGYGYILHESKKVLAFIEKPNSEKSEELIRQNALWNLGMVYSKVGTFLSLVKQLQPDLFQACLDIHQKRKDNCFSHQIIRFCQFLYSGLPTISIDRAILEKTQDLGVLEVDFLWQDMGSIKAITENKNNSKNVSLLNSENVFINGNSKSVVIQNLNNISIIETENQIFILKS